MEPPQPSPNRSEDRIIERLLAYRADRPAWLQLDAGDDCAILGDGQAITTDALIEGVHFDDRLAASDVGFKCVAASISDLAACGAMPRWVVLALSLPASRAKGAWPEAFAQGVGEACRTFGAHLIGGDVTRVPGDGPTAVSVTAAGQVSRPMTRQGAAPDDDLWVTGTPGLAGQVFVDNNPSAEALQALRRPLPPVAFAVALARAELASAAMDVSDGLAADIPRLAAASRVGVAASMSSNDPRLPGGDDYGLLFAAPHQHAHAVNALAETHNVSLTHLGRFDATGVVRATDGRWPRPAFEHFVEDA